MECIGIYFPSSPLPGSGSQSSTLLQHLQRSRLTKNTNAAKMQSFLTSGFNKLKQKFSAPSGRANKEEESWESIDQAETVPPQPPSYAKTNYRKFFGSNDPKECELFLRELDFEFTQNQKYYPHDAAKVGLAVTLLEGKAKDFYEVTNKKQPELLTTWRAFSDALRDRFQYVTLYQKQMHNPWFQMGRPLQEYIDRFEGVATEVGLPHSKWADLFVKGLDSSYKDELSKLSKISSSSYSRVKHLAMVVDKQVSAIKAQYFARRDKERRDLEKLLGRPIAFGDPDEDIFQGAVVVEDSDSELFR